MAWVKIDDHFDEHPKLAAVGPLGWGYWLAGLAYCNRNLTDGFIPWAKARTLASFEMIEAPAQAPAQAESNDHDSTIWSLSRSSGMAGEDITADWMVRLMVKAGLWDEVPGGYQIHDYADFQPTKAQVLEEREKKREAGRAGGKASAQARGQAGAKPSAQAKSNPVPVPVPDPSSPSGEDIPPTPKRTRKKSQTLTPEQMTRFERWYSVFPRKVNRAKAEEKWAEIDPDDELTDVMVSKTEEWAASPDWTKNGGQYVPHPATWLHNKRWTDDSPSQVPDVPGSLRDVSRTRPLNEITDPRDIIPGPRGYTTDQLRRKSELERNKLEQERLRATS